jgi:hypothetical protein
MQYFSTKKNHLYIYIYIYGVAGQPIYGAKVGRTTPGTPRGGPLRRSGGGATTPGAFGGGTGHHRLLVGGRPPQWVVGHP